jgi:proteasome lid subunit RPN8/RPN11
MLKRLRTAVNSLRKRSASAYRPAATLPQPQLIITESALHAMKENLAPEIAKGHEGIAYLFGQTDGETTIVIGAIRPQALTTRGSFDVPSVAMTKVVRKANDTGLQVVGQIHTHPGQAYHSDGDIDGARIAYNGFISIVVPDYGRHLPSLVGAAAYFYRSKAFLKLQVSAITVTNGRF